MSCFTCESKQAQVHVSGEHLEGMDAKLIKLLLERCAVVLPQHVIKKKEHSFAFLHSKTKLDAETFYLYHNHENIPICIQLGIEKVNPTLVTIQVSPTVRKQKPVTYDFSPVQRGLATTTLCKYIQIKEAMRHRLLYQLGTLQEEEDLIQQELGRLN